MQRKIHIIRYLLFFLVNVIHLPAMANKDASYTEAYDELKIILTSDPEKALARTNELLAKDHATFSTHELLNIFEIKLYSYLYTNNYPEVFKVIDEIKTVVNKDKSPLAHWKLSYMQGTVYWHTEQGNKAIEHYLKAYEFIKPHQDYTYERANTENALGYISVKLGFYKESIPYLTKSLAFNQQRKDPLYLAQAYNNLGEAYFGLENYKKSAELHQNSLNIRLKNKLTFHSSYSFHNLGLAYKVQGEARKAEENFLQAIKIRKESNFIKGLLASQLELARLYSETDQAHAGGELLLEIITAAKKEKKHTTLSEAYKLQTELYQNKKQFESAFNALKNYQQILEKIQLNINDAELSGYITKLSTVTKDLDILSLNKKNEIKELKINSIAQRSHIIITFSLIIVTVLSIFLWLLYQKRKNIQIINHSLSVTLDDLRITQKRLIESEKMAAVTLLVSGVAHKINTPLGIGLTAISHIDYTVKNFSELLKVNQVKKSTFTNLVHELEQGCSLALNNMNNVAELVNHFKLLSTQLGDDKKEQFNVLQLLTKESEISLSNISCNKPVITIHGAKVCLISYPTALHKVIGHLISNSVIHAFTDQDNPIIDIAVSVDEIKGYVEIIYQDNGKGIAKDMVTKIFTPFYTLKMGGHNIGLGLSVAYNLVVQLMQGNIICDVSHHNITSFKITLPINLAED